MFDAGSVTGTQHDTLRCWPPASLNLLACRQLEQQLGDCSPGATLQLLLDFSVMHAMLKPLVQAQHEEGFDSMMETLQERLHLDAFNDKQLQRARKWLQAPAGSLSVEQIQSKLSALLKSAVQQCRLSELCFRTPELPQQPVSSEVSDKHRS